MTSDNKKSEYIIDPFEEFCYFNQFERTVVINGDSQENIKNFYTNIHILKKEFPNINFFIPIDKRQIDHLSKVYCEHYTPLPLVLFFKKSEIYQSKTFVCFESLKKEIHEFINSTIETKNTDNNKTEIKSIKKKKKKKTKKKKTIKKKTSNKKINKKKINRKRKNKS